MTFEKVKRIIVETLNVKDEAKVTMEAHLVNDLGADSLDAVDIIMGIEDEFGISVSDDAITTIKTDADLVNAIDSELGK